MNGTVTNHFRSLKPVTFEEFQVKYNDAYENLHYPGIRFADKVIGIGPTPQGVYWRIDDETGDDVEALPPLSGLQYWDDDAGEEEPRVSVWDPNLKTWLYVYLVN